MKKIYTLLAVLAFAFSATAQIDLKTVMSKPTAGTTWDAGQFYPFEILVTVVSGNVTPTDTVFYTFTDGSKIYFRPGLTKGPGDTIQYKNNIGYGTGVTPKNNYKWCSWAFVRKGTVYTDPTHSNDTSCTTINITNTTGIGNDPSAKIQAENVSQQMVIVPNPASGIILLDYTSSSNATITAKVIDITGREVMSANFSAYSGQKGYQLNVAALTPGMYFIKIGQEGRFATGKLIKE